MKFARIPSDEISYLPLGSTEEPLPAMLAARAVAGRRAAKAASLENMACSSVDLTQQVVASRSKWLRVSAMNKTNDNTDVKVGQA